MLGLAAAFLPSLERSRCLSSGPPRRRSAGATVDKRVGKTAIGQNVKNLKARTTFQYQVKCNYFKSRTEGTVANVPKATARDIRSCVFPASVLMGPRQHSWCVSRSFHSADAYSNGGK